LHPARTAPAQFGIVVLFHVRATFVLAASAHVLVVRDKPCPGHRTPQNLLERDSAAHKIAYYDVAVARIEGERKGAAPRRRAPLTSATIVSNQSAVVATR